MTWPADHQKLKTICREGILKIQEIKNPCLDENYDFVLAITVLAGHVLQRAWRFSAFCRFTLEDMSHAFAHKDRIWLDTETKGCHRGIILSHALTIEFMEICQYYTRSWRCLVSGATVTKELLLHRNGKSLLHAHICSQEIMRPAFSSSSIRPLSNTEIRKIEVKHMLVFGVKGDRGWGAIPMIIVYRLHTGDGWGNEHSNCRARQFLFDMYIK
jgi:hypothetical protein